MSLPPLSQPLGQLLGQSMGLVEGVWVDVGIKCAWLEIPGVPATKTSQMKGTLS